MSDITTGEGLAGRRATILLVDDNEALRSIIREVLEERRFSVLEAADGRTALALARQYDVDLLVTDVVMPGMSGDELAGRLRAESGVARVVFMSATSGRGQLELDVLPTAPFLHKPFGVDSLLMAVRAALDR